MEVKVKLTASSMKQVDQLIKRILEIEKEHKVNCTLLDVDLDVTFEKTQQIQCSDLELLK